MSFYLLDNSSVNGTQWQQWGYPRRGASLSGTVIMHTAESVLDVIGNDSGAEDCAAFIARRTGSYGSYHSLVDSDSIIEMAPYEYETWQDSETNPWAVGISAACRTTDWVIMGNAKLEGYYRNLARCAADFVKYMRTKGIEVPRKQISGIEARARIPGFCAHGDSGIARTDPGRDFDWNRFFQYIEQELNGTVTGEDEMAVLDEPVNQIGGGQITLRQMLAEYRPHVTKTHDDLKVIKEQTHESMLNDRTQVYALQDVLKGMSPQDIALALDAKQIAKEVMEEISKIIAE